MTSPVPLKLFRDAFPATLECEYCEAGARHEHHVSCGGPSEATAEAPVCVICNQPMRPVRIRWETEGWLFRFVVANVPAFVCDACGDDTQFITAGRLSALYTVAAAHYHRGRQHDDAARKVFEKGRWQRVAERDQLANPENDLAFDERRHLGIEIGTVEDDSGAGKSELRVLFGDDTAEQVGAELSAAAAG